MKKTSVFLFSTIVLFVILGIAYACTNKNKETKPNVSQSDVDKLIMSKLHLTNLDLTTIDLNKINIFGKSDPNQVAVMAYSTETSGENIVLYSTKSDPQNFLAVRYINVDGKYYVEKEVETHFQLDCNGTGIVEVINNAEGKSFTSTFINGKLVATSGVRILTNSLKSTLGFHWCQREKGETTGTCFTREVNEFCSDFIGIVAFYTNPQIAILIAAECSCDAPTQAR